MYFDLQKLAHACTLLPISRGVGLPFLLRRANRFLTVVSKKNIFLGKAFLTQWAQHDGDISHCPEAVSLQHCIAAYVRTTIPNPSRKIVAALLCNASSHLRSVEATCTKPSVDIVASLVLEFVASFFSIQPVSILQQWAPGFLRFCSLMASTLEQKSTQLVTLFLRGVIVRCVLCAIVEPRRFGVYERNIPLDFRIGLYSTACTALDTRRLQRWTSASFGLTGQGWLIASHEYQTFHNRKGWQTVLSILRTRCRHLLLKHFNEVFLYRDGEPFRSENVLVESHTFRRIDPLIIAIYAVMDVSSRIASPLMSPTNSWNDYLELDLWAMTKSHSTGDNSGSDEHGTGLRKTSAQHDSEKINRFSSQEQDDGDSALATNPGQDTECSKKFYDTDSSRLSVDDSVFSSGRVSIDSQSQFQFSESSKVPLEHLEEKRPIAMTSDLKSVAKFPKQ